MVGQLRSGRETIASGAQIQALTDALTAFTTTINNIGAPPAAGGRAPPPAHVPIHDLDATTDAFDLAKRAGLDALKEISKPLDHVWNGSSTDFPPFLVALRLWANEGHWNETGASWDF